MVTETHWLILVAGLAAAATWRFMGPIEWLKWLSDQIVVWLLQFTSGFGAELSPEGIREQEGWRKIRRRDLQWKPAPAIHSGRQRIVVLGGGVGGLATATSLGQAIGGRHDVILVDRSRDHIFKPAFLFVMVGEREPEQLTGDLTQVERRGVTFRQSAVRAIDPGRQKIELEDGPLEYDYLVISLGLRTVPGLLPGFNEGAHHSWEMDAALRVRSALREFQEGKILVGIPPGPYRCPPAPFEVQWMLDSYFEERGIRDRVEIEYFTPVAEPAGEERTPDVWMDTQSKKRGVRHHYSFTAQSIDPERKIVRGLYGVGLSYDLLFMVPPHEPPSVLLDSNLAENRNGIRVEYESLVTRWGNIYAIGDNADMPVSKSGGVAHQQAEVVARNLINLVSGEEERAQFRLQTL